MRGFQFTRRRAAATTLLSLAALPILMVLTTQVLRRVRADQAMNDAVSLPAAPHQVAPDAPPYLALLPWAGRSPLCEGKVDDAGRCGHGPDPAPDGYDVSRPVPLLAPDVVSLRKAVRAAKPDLSLCVGDGSSGPRVQVVYAGLLGSPDRYADSLPSIREWIYEVDGIVRDSAAKTSGRRRVRFVHDGACNPVVSRVQLSAAIVDDIGQMADEMLAQGFNRKDRAYLVFVDLVDHTCGVAFMDADDRPDADNANNSGPAFARVDRGCWGSFVAAHELFHNLGAVQGAAPHKSAHGHCTDDFDVMCYDDSFGGPPVIMQQICVPEEEHERLLDCREDDYFHTDPPPGSYLDSHWNSADSVFLTADADPTPEPDCPRTVSEVNDWRRVVLDCDGGLRQPGIIPGEPCSDFEVTFIAPADGDYLFNGPSTELWLDSDADGIPDERIAARTTGFRVRLQAGAVYTARSYQPTPGFALLPASP